MNMELRERVRPARVKPAVIDCDIHPRIPNLEALRPYMAQRWWDYLQTYGARVRHGFARGYPYPKAAPLACRRDAWPANGGPPASDLDFMRAQHLDPYGLQY